MGTDAEPAEGTGTDEPAGTDASGQTHGDVQGDQTVVQGDQTVNPPAESGQDADDGGTEPQGEDESPSE